VDRADVMHDDSWQMLLCEACWIATPTGQRNRRMPADRTPTPTDD